MNETILAVVLAGAIVGGAYFVAQKRKENEDGTDGAGICEAAGQYKGACNAALGILGELGSAIGLDRKDSCGGPSYDEINRIEATNNRINGPCKLWVRNGYAKLYCATTRELLAQEGGPRPDGVSSSPASCLVYENGCVPIQGTGAVDLFAHARAKCLKGTVPYTTFIASRDAKVLGLRYRFGKYDSWLLGAIDHRTT